VTGFKVWGVSSGERELTYPCDRFMETPDASYYRGVTIHATPAAVFCDKVPASVPVPVEPVP